MKPTVDGPSHSGERSSEDQRAVGFDPAAVRKDFPALEQTVHGRPLVYLDNAATTQKPHPVIEAISDYYRYDNANVHRGLHTLSVRATNAYEGVRGKVRRFINAAADNEIVFTHGTTEGVNLLAWSLGAERVEKDSEIIVSQLEHHSNIVPWQMLCERTGARLRVIPIDHRGEVRMEEFRRILGPKTRIVAVAHVSNALGTVLPVREIADLAHKQGAVVVVDGAQAVQHLRVDVRALGADFYVFSSHKMYGPTGIGVVYGRAELLESLPPYQGGGDMIASVSFEETTYNRIPYRFEAGTPSIAGAVGLGAAIDYLEALGIDTVVEAEEELLRYATGALERIDRIRFIGTASERCGVLSFVIDGIHPHDIGTILDQEGIAVRAGHHCAQPVMEHFGIPATTRASLALYNTRDDIDALVRGVKRTIEVMG